MTAGGNVGSGGVVAMGDGDGVSDTVAAGAAVKTGVAKTAGVAADSFSDGVHPPSSKTNRARAMLHLLFRAIYIFVLYGFFIIDIITDAL